MAIEIRLPNIAGQSEKEQLAQLKSYLYQLVEQLQYAFDNIDTGNNVSPGHTQPQVVTYQASASPVNPEATFNAIKSLIIKSADIVDAYYDEINTRLEGAYVAESDFGAYAKKTAQTIEQNSTSTTQRFESIQILINNQDGTIASMGEDISSTKEELSSSISSTKESLEGDINSAKTELSGSIESAKSQLSEDISSAKEELTGVVSGVDADLQSTKTEVNGRIDVTNGTVANLNDQLGLAKDSITNVNNDLQTTKGNINDTIQGVQDRVKGAEDSLEAAKSELEGSIAELGKYANGLGDSILAAKGYIKTGELYEIAPGVPVYGLEIGQTVADETVGEVFRQYARFTSGSLTFFDSNGIEVAYISDKKLYIRLAEIEKSLKVGGFEDTVIEATGDVVTKWVGGN